MSDQPTDQPTEQTTDHLKTVLNLEGPINRDQFEASVNAAHSYLEDILTDRYDWCSDRHRYFAVALPGYINDDWNSTGSLQIITVPEHDDYAPLLKDMRGKILWYAKAGTINLDDANEIFRASALPEYDKKNKGGFRLLVNLPPFNINVMAESVEEARDWARDNIRDFVARMMDGKPPTDDDKYVPGSVVIPNRYIEVTNNPERVTIDEADTVRPSYS